MTARNPATRGPWHSISTGGGLRLASSLAIAMSWQEGCRAADASATSAPTPEETIEIVFMGLSSREQEIAVKSFPGGQRFRLGEMPPGGEA